MIYLDNAATTKPMDFLKNFYIEYQDKYWFNPSSIYYSARTVKKEIEKTREIIANIFDISPENMFFTFSGTYSNNLILNYNTIKNISKKFTGLKGKPKIISGIWEHSSVVNPLKNIKNRLNNEFEVEFIDLKEIYKTIFKGKNNFKNLITEKILNSIDENTILVSIMWIHNETGLIFPVKEIARK
jgi:cysteine desulfurase